MNDKPEPKETIESILSETESSDADRRPTRFLAGPGTGKTTQMMKRISDLLKLGVPPEKILVCTFTRAAVNDLLKSLSAEGMPSEAKKIKAVTLHSLSLSILSQQDYFTRTGRKPRSLLKFEKKFLSEDLKCKEFDGYVGVGDLLKEFGAAWAIEPDKDPSWPTDPKQIHFQLALMEWLTTHNAMLLEELVPETFNYLRFTPNSEVLSQYTHVFIDEYQDLNKVEQELLNMISNGSKVTIFGDENQSIYRFKYAFFDGITSFHLTHPGTQDETLNVSHRCSEPVISMANSLISHNPSCVHRDMEPSDPTRRTEVSLLQWNDYYDECVGISKIIRRLIDEKGYNPGQIIILAPNKYFALDLTDYLAKQDIVAKSFFTDPLFEINPRKSETCQALYNLSLLRYFVDPNDIVSLRCLLGYGESDLNSENWKRLLAHCAETGQTQIAALERILDGSLELSKSTRLKDRYKILKAQMQELDVLTGLELVDKLFPKDKDWAKQLRDFSLDLAVESIEPKSLNDHLIAMLSQPELPIDVDYVRIMSLFKSKGLTSDIVVIVGVVRGLLPQPPEEKMTDKEKHGHQEEQRRMFYVGITRAKRVLILSYFSRIDLELGRKMRLEPNNSGYSISLHHSPFLPELGHSCPKPILGKDYYPIN